MDFRQVKHKSRTLGFDPFENTEASPVPEKTQPLTEQPAAFPADNVDELQKISIPAAESPTQRPTPKRGRKEKAASFTVKPINLKVNRPAVRISNDDVPLPRSLQRPTVDEIIKQAQAPEKKTAESTSLQTLAVAAAAGLALWWLTGSAAPPAARPQFYGYGGGLRGGLH